MIDSATDKKINKSKGGRPNKAIKKNKLLGVKCSLLEKVTIQQKAKRANLSVSEYLRKLGVSGKIVIHIKTIPPEVAAFKADLNHMSANINQIARKRNYNDQLDAFERAHLQQLPNLIKEFLTRIDLISNDRENNHRKIFQRMFALLLK